MLSAFLVPIKIGPGFWSRVPGVGPGFYSFPDRDDPTPFSSSCSCGCRNYTRVIDTVTVLAGEARLSLQDSK